MTTSKRPLEGRLVLDFSSLLPGPLATLILAEAGADVVKVERVEGDDMRGFHPRWGADSANFALLNRGKKSLALDLKREEDRQMLEPLVRRADVLVEQFRPGVMARLGLDYENVRSVNPRIVYCSITGYGQTGPKRDVVGHDLNYIGDVGMLATSCGDPRHPLIPPALVADVAGGAYPAVMNILLALMRREHNDQGCKLDISMTDNLFPFLYWGLGSGFAAGVWPGNGVDLVTGGSPRYRLYPTLDGKLVAAAPIEQRFWITFCELIGLDLDLRDDAIAPAATARRIEEIIAGHDAAFWKEVFALRDCACSIVRTLEEAIADPHYACRNLFAHKVRNERGDVMPALPVPLDAAFRRSSSDALAAPSLGCLNIDSIL